MQSARVRRIIILTVIALMILPAVLAADAVQRAATGDMIVRFAAPSVGAPIILTSRSNRRNTNSSWQSKTTL